MSHHPLPITVETTVGGVRLVLQTGQVARQAHGAVIATLGGTMCFAAACVGPQRDDIDFFPLTVDYREKTEAAGKIPGGFFKREGRPTTKETLTMRLIDRAIRPLFPDEFTREVQVMSHTLSYDGSTNPDVCAMIAAFAAVRISGVPFKATLGAVRIGHLDGKLCAFPPDERRREESRLDLVVAAHKAGFNMVESSAKELSEEEMVEALQLAQEVINGIIAAIDELKDKVARQQMDWTAPVVDEALKSHCAAYAARLDAVLPTPGKHERYSAIDALKKDCVKSWIAAGAADDAKNREKEAKKYFGNLVTERERELILQGKRVDGRTNDEIRPITIVPNFIPRQHGSVLFTRGETQAMVSCTLGTPDDEQIIDGIESEYKKAFYLHYNFPPYSVGETKRLGGPGRREIGHGMLAERALAGVMPAKARFPYTVRIVSDITESNGSSSMASVCGGCLSMMLAGVPVAQPVAGIAMGLITDGQPTSSCRTSWGRKTTTATWTSRLRVPVAVSRPCRWTSRSTRSRKRR